MNSYVKTFIVLGMHRSATSLVADGVNRIIDMGAEYNEMPDQPNGNWEDREFVQLNEEILIAAGGSWDNPPSHESIMAQKESFRTHITSLVATRNKNGLHWGWKDPRTVLTVDLYKEHLIRPHYICCFRDPRAVAKSLRLRNGFPIAKGMALALEYNKRLSDFLTKNYVERYL